jgi:hypothetical protein
MKGEKQFTKDSILHLDFSIILLDAYKAGIHN